MSAAETAAVAAYDASRERAPPSQADAQWLMSQPVR